MDIEGAEWHTWQTWIRNATQIGFHPNQTKMLSDAIQGARGNDDRASLSRWPPFGQLLAELHFSSADNMTDDHKHVRVLRDFRALGMHPFYLRENWRYTRPRPIHTPAGLPVSMCTCVDVGWVAQDQAVSTQQWARGEGVIDKS
jgi:hypothetical protein